MKKIIMIAIATSFALSSYAQKINEKEVPVAVKNAFAKAFPNATNVKWSKEDANEFESEFRVGKEEKSAVFDNTGTWINTETEIEESNLPADVQSSIKKEYPGYRIQEAEVLETPNGGEIL